MHASSFVLIFVEESLIVVLKEHLWWPHFEQDSDEAERIKIEVRDSVEETDVAIYDSSEKIVISHTPTDSRGTLSLESGVWVLRILNPSIHLLQLACETFVVEVANYAARNHKKIEFTSTVQIVERKRKETIIEGRPLATARERVRYARKHKQLEFTLFWGGVIFLIALLMFTYPYSWRNLSSPQQTWIFSIFEKFIGSVAVTTLIAFLGYRSFVATLRDHTVEWSIPGAPEKLEIKHRSA